MNQQNANLIIPTEKTMPSNKPASKKEPVKFIIKESFKGIKNLEDIFTDIVLSEYDSGKYKNN